MAEREPGHPDKLVRTLRNWLREASDPIGSLPAGTDPAEWAVRRFIASWVRPVRASVREIEDCLRKAEEACRAGDMDAAAAEDLFGAATGRRESAGPPRAILVGGPVAP